MDQNDRRSTVAQETDTVVQRTDTVVQETDTVVQETDTVGEETDTVVWKTDVVVQGTDVAQRQLFQVPQGKLIEQGKRQYGSLQQQGTDQNDFFQNTPLEKL